MDTALAPTLSQDSSDLLLVRLAREIAIEIHPLEKILASLGISQDKFNYIKELPRFQELLMQEITQWRSATNTQERVKLKSAAMVEELLPELFERMHDKSEALPAKIETAKLVTKLAGMGQEKTGDSAREHFSLTIKIGEGKNLEIQGDRAPTIDHEPEDVSSEFKAELESLND